MWGWPGVSVPCICVSPLLEYKPLCSTSGLPCYSERKLIINRFQASSLSSSLEFFIVSHNTDLFWYASIQDPVVNWIGLKFSTELSILPIITTICLRKFVTAQVRHQHQLSDWLRRYNKSTTNRIQTPLLRFVVDLLWTRNCCTTNPQHLDMSRCCGFVVGDRFVVDLLYNISICRGFVVDLLWIWICCTTCCITNPQQIE